MFSKVMPKLNVVSVRRSCCESKCRLLQLSLTNRGQYILMAVLFPVWVMLTIGLAAVGRYSIFADLNNNWRWPLMSTFFFLGLLFSLLYAIIFRADRWNFIARSISLYLLVSMVLSEVAIIGLHLYMGITPLTANMLGLLWLNWHSSDGQVVVFSVIFLQAIGLVSFYILRHPKTLGGAHFQTLAEARKNNLIAQSGPVFLLGKLNGFWVSVKKVVVTIVSETGAGKTAALIIPNMLRDTGSMIVNDNSGELYDLLHKHFEAKGYRVYRWSPFDNDSDGWNPLMTIRWSADHLDNDLNSIVNTLVPSSINKDGGEGSSKFFTENTRDIIKSLIIYQYCHHGLNPKRFSIEAIMKSVLTTNIETLFTDLLKISKQQASFIHHSAKMCVGRLEGKDGETKQNVLMSAQTHLASLYSPRVLHTLSEQTIDLKAIRHEKTVLFITVPADEVVNERMRPFLTLFYRRFMDHVIGDGVYDETRHQMVTCYLDEFGNMGRVNTIVNSTTDKRKYGCRFMFIVQYRSQVEEIYGRNTATAVLDVSTRLMGASGVNNDCQVMSQALGKQERKKKIGKGKGAYFDIVKEPLLEAAALTRLSNTDWVVSITGLQPLRLKKGFYFEDVNMLDGLPAVKKLPL